MSRPDIPANANDTVGTQHRGLIHLAFEVPTMEEVDRLAATFRELGLPILSGPRRTGDGYYEFETLDPDKNRIEVTTLFRDH
jgi:lactoylglutathione lyase